MRAWDADAGIGRRVDPGVLEPPSQRAWTGHLPHLGDDEGVAFVAVVDTIRAREILDCRGETTLEVDVELSGGQRGRAAVPSGGSKGRHEAAQMRNDRPWSRGVGSAAAVSVVNETIAPALRGTDFEDQVALDTKLLEMDGTPDKSRLGANCMLGVSMAFARSAARAAGLPLYAHLVRPGDPLLPLPLFDVLNGGAHADNGLEIEEFMVVPIGARSLSEAVRWGGECFTALRAVLEGDGFRTVFGDHGGFAPDLGDNVEAIELLLEAMRSAGFRAGKDVVLALDAAASGYYDGEAYRSPGAKGTRISSAELVDFWVRLCRDYPIWSIEDGIAEDDLEGWLLLTRALGSEVVLVGDDVFATDPDVISGAIVDEIGNAIVVKPDQIGTITEALEAIEEARAGHWVTVVASRAGDTTDDFLADFAVATAAGAIKAGAPCRGERVAKYNQLLRIEEELGPAARFAGATGLRRPSR